MGAYHSTSIPTQKYPENTPKVPRKCHVFLYGETYLSSLHGAGDAAVASSRDNADPWALSPITENGTVKVLKSLIFQYRIFEFCLKKANLRQNWLDRPSERVLGEAMPAHGCRGRPETSK